MEERVDDLLGRMTVAEKVGEPPPTEPVRIGSAAIDKGRCLPWANETPCIVCEEVCPTSPKAILLEEIAVTDPLGATRRLRRPQVIPERCVGCGICEYRCPVDGAGAIRVAGTGRTGQGSPFDLGA